MGHTIAAYWRRESSFPSHRALTTPSSQKSLGPVGRSLSCKGLHFSQNLNYVRRRVVNQSISHATWRSSGKSVDTEAFPGLPLGATLMRMTMRRHQGGNTTYGSREQEGHWLCLWQNVASCFGEFSPVSFLYTLLPWVSSGEQVTLWRTAIFQNLQMVSEGQYLGACPSSFFTHKASMSRAPTKASKELIVTTLTSNMAVALSIEAHSLHLSF